MVLSNPCFEKCEKYHVFRSFHRNGTSYSTVPSFVNILNHSWLKIWGIWRRKYRFFFIISRFLPFTHRDRPYEPLLHTTSQYGRWVCRHDQTTRSSVKPGRGFIRHDGDKLNDHSIIHLLFLNILPCVALKTETKMVIKQTENLTQIEIYSLSACRMEQNILGKKRKKEESHPR